MNIQSNLYLNEELFYFQLAVCEDAIDRGITTPENDARYKELLTIENDPAAMSFIRAQHWGSNRRSG